MEKEHVEVLLEEVRDQLQFLAEGHMATQAAIGEVHARLDKVDSRLDKVDSRLDHFDAKMDRRFDRVESELHKIGDGLADHEQRIAKLEKRRR